MPGRGQVCLTGQQLCGSKGGSLLAVIAHLVLVENASSGELAEGIADALEIPTAQALPQDLGEDPSLPDPRLFI